MRFVESTRYECETSSSGYAMSESNLIHVVRMFQPYKFEERKAEADATTEASNRRARLTMSLRGPLSHIDYNFSGMMRDTDSDHETVLEEFRKVKLSFMVWRAFTSKIESYELTVRDTEIVWEIYINSHVENDTIEYEKQYHSSIEKILNSLYAAFNSELSHNDVGNGRRRFNETVSNIVDRIDYQERNIADEKKVANTNKFANILGAAYIVEDDVIEEQLLTAYKLLPGNGLVARTWGFEVEVPDAKGVDAPAGVDKGEDGSLRSYESSDCECSCDDCTCHDCDCDYCDSRRDGDDHCGSGDCASADSAEFRTTGGLQRIISPALYKLCKDLNDSDAEKNDTAGTHIHVYAKDLTTNQIGQVLASYKRLEPLMAIICGREDVNYARNIPMEYIRASLKKRGATINTDKPRAINIGHLTNNRGTIEFRQMDCNLDANRMTVWAWICRAFVTSAKRGMTFKDVLNVTDLVSLIEVFAKFNVMLHDENPEQIVYGSKTDYGTFTLEVHKVH